jgi:hypothetical protein
MHLFGGALLASGIWGETIFVGRGTVVRKHRTEDLLAIIMKLAETEQYPGLRVFCEIRS